MGGRGEFVEESRGISGERGKFERLGVRGKFWEKKGKNFVEERGKLWD